MPPLSEVDLPWQTLRAPYTQQITDKYATNCNQSMLNYHAFSRPNSVRNTTEQQRASSLPLPRTIN